MLATTTILSIRLPDYRTHLSCEEYPPPSCSYTTFKAVTNDWMNSVRKATKWSSEEIPVLVQRTVRWRPSRTYASYIFSENPILASELWPIQQWSGNFGRLVCVSRARVKTQYFHSAQRSEERCRRSCSGDCSRDCTCQ